MANEIKILIRTQNSAKAGFNEVDKDLDEFAKTSSEKFSKTFSENFSKHLSETITTHLKTVADKAQEAARGAGDQIGDEIGRRAGERISTRISEKIKTVFRRDSNNSSDSSSRSGGLGRDRERVHVDVDVDVDKQSLGQKLSGVARSIGEKFSGFFSQGFGSVFSSDIISMIIKSLAVGALAAALGPVLGAAITAALGLGLGGGAIAIGIIGAFKDPRIKAAAAGLKTEIGKTFEGFADNFKGPLENFLAGSGKGGSAGLIGVFRSLKPMIDDLGKALGPVADKLGQGIIGLLQNALPGIIRAMEKSAPIIEKLAEKLPGIGDAIGRFFDHIGNGAPEAAQFLGDFLEGVQLIIRALGFLIEWLTKAYGFIRTTFVAGVEFVQAFINAVRGIWGIFSSVFNRLIDKAGDFLHAASAAFGWIPGIGPKLRTAEAQFNNFKNRANSSIKGIVRNVVVTVKFNIVGLAGAKAAIDTARILHNLGYAAGGITGHAAEGGPRNGLTWVGENGPELVDLAPGSKVHTAGDSQRMAGQGGQLQVVGRMIVDRTTERGVVDALMRMFRVEISQFHGGDVQAALGGPS